MVHNAPRSNSMISQRKLDANRRNAAKSTGAASPGPSHLVEMTENCRIIVGTMCHIGYDGLQV
jgi:hypothetical protein